MKHLFNSPLFEELEEMGNPKTMQERLLDSFIVASIQFFTVLGIFGFPPGPKHFYAAFMSFWVIFFSQWAFERGVKSFKGK